MENHCRKLPQLFERIPWVDGCEVVQDVMGKKDPALEFRPAIHPPLASTGPVRFLSLEPKLPGSVLFDYVSRPTAPGLPAQRPSSGTLLISERPSTDLGGLKQGLSLHEIPNWSDRDVPPTQRPSAGPRPPSTIPAKSEGLTGTLTRMDGPNAGRVFALSPGQLTIGRNPRADLHLPEDGVSRKHARICWINGGYVLEDLASQNGTFVAGQPVDIVELRQGDVIRIGPLATLRFCWMDEHQKLLLDELYETSVRDPLTGAFNRRHFSERLECELAYATRHHTELSLLLVDIDYFKKINDQYGHLEGDRVLVELSRVCHQQLRTEDVFARYGGEEFAVLLRGIALPGAVRAAERLRVAVANHVSVGTPRLAVSVSIGCAAVTCLEQVSAGGLIHITDQRLYEAKRAGRGRVVAEGYASRE